MIRSCGFRSREHDALPLVAQRPREAEGEGTAERILAEADISKVDALKIDVEGFEDRVLSGFFRDAPPALWPRAVVIEHLSKQEWLSDCIADMVGRGYREAGRTRSNTFLQRG